MFNLTINRFHFTVEFFGWEAVYIRIGSFERFYDRDGSPSH
jgi:hypothetical protein